MKEEKLEDKIKYISFYDDPKFFQVRNNKDLYVNRGTIEKPVYQLLKRDYLKDV